jgi:F-box-like
LSYQSYPVHKQCSTSIHALPAEIITNIFTYFSEAELCTVAKVCTFWSAISEDPFFWSKHHMNRLGFLPEKISAHEFLKICGRKRTAWKTHLKAGDFERRLYTSENLVKDRVPNSLTSTFLAQHLTINGKNFRGIAVAGPRAKKIALFNSDGDPIRVIQNSNNYDDVLKDFSIFPLNGKNVLAVHWTSGQIQLFWPEKPEVAFGFLQNPTLSPMHSFIYEDKSFIAIRSRLIPVSNEYYLSLFSVNEDGISPKPTGGLTLKGMKQEAYKVMRYRNQREEYIVAISFCGVIYCWNPKLKQQPLWQFSVKNFIKNIYKKKDYEIEDNYYDLKTAIPFMVVSNGEKDDILLTRSSEGNLIILRPNISQTPVSFDQIILKDSANIKRISIVKSPTGRPYAVGFQHGVRTFLRSWSLDDGKMYQKTNTLPPIIEHTLLQGPEGPYLMVTHFVHNAYVNQRSISFWSLFKGENFKPQRIGYKTGQTKLFLENLTLKTTTAVPSGYGYDNIFAEYQTFVKHHNQLPLMKREFELWDFAVQKPGMLDKVKKLYANLSV